MDEATRTDLTQSLTQAERFSWNETQGFVLLFPTPIATAPRANGYPRESIAKLRDLVQPPIRLTRGGNLSTHQPPNPPYKEYKFWLSQLLHYGLPFQDTSDLAKATLLDGMRSGTLQVPPRLATLERDLRTTTKKSIPQGSAEGKPITGEEKKALRVPLRPSSSTVEDKSGNYEQEKGEPGAATSSIGRPGGSGMRADIKQTSTSASVEVIVISDSEDERKSIEKSTQKTKKKHLSNGSFPDIEQPVRKLRHAQQSPAWNSGKRNSSSSNPRNFSRSIYEAPTARRRRLSMIEPIRLDYGQLKSRRTLRHRQQSDPNDPFLPPSSVKKISNGPKRHINPTPSAKTLRRRERRWRQRHLKVDAHNG